MPIVFDNDEDTYFDDHEMIRVRNGMGLNRRNKMHKEIYMHNGDGILDVFDDVGTWILNTANDAAKIIAGPVKGVIDVAKTINNLGGELKENSSIHKLEEKGDGIILDENIKTKRGNGANKKILSDIIKKADKISARTGSGIKIN